MDRGPGWYVIDDRVIVADAVEISLQRTHLMDTWRDDPLPSYGAAGLVQGTDGVMASVGVDEAFWIAFQRFDSVGQAAVRICVEVPEMSDAVTGGAWNASLSSIPQNYIVVPPQFALDGIGLGTDQARQFIGRSGDGRNANCAKFRCIVYPGTSGQNELYVQTVATQPLRSPGPPTEDTSGGQALVRKWIALDDSRRRWDVSAGIEVPVVILGSAEFTRQTGQTPVAALDSNNRYSGRRFP